MSARRPVRRCLRSPSLPLEHSPPRLSGHSPQKAADAPWCPGLQAPVSIRRRTVVSTGWRSERNPMFLRLSLLRLTPKKAQNSPSLAKFGDTGGLLTAPTVKTADLDSKSAVNVGFPAHSPWPTDQCRQNTATKCWQLAACGKLKGTENLRAGLDSYKAPPWGAYGGLLAGRIPAAVSCRQRRRRLAAFAGVSFV